MAKKAEQVEQGAKGTDRVEASDDEIRLAVVLGRGHLSKQPMHGLRSVWEGMTPARQKAALGRLAQLSEKERKALRDELDGKSPTSAAVGSESMDKVVTDDKSGSGGGDAGK